jgi:hypothetical protein
VSTAAEIARAAYERAQKDEQQRQKIAAIEASKRIERKLAAGTPILERWFPGVQWTVVDDGEQDYYSALVVTDGSLKLKIEHYNVDLEAEQPAWRTRIYAVERTYRNGYYHWIGPEVKNPTDIGKWLAGKALDRYPTN